VVSRRYRENRSVANKLNSLTNKTAEMSKDQKAVATETNAVTPASIAPAAVESTGIAGRAVTSDKIARSAVTTESLGVINQINAGGDLQLEMGISGHLALTGGRYEEPYDNLATTAGLRTLAFDPVNNAVVVYNAEPGAGAGGGASVTVSTTAPVSPSEGDIWVYDVDGSTFVYYTDGTSNQWIEIGAQTTPFYPPVAFVDVVTFNLTATVTIVPFGTGTPTFVHPEIISSTVTDSFQVVKAGYYEIGFEGAATSIESGNRVTIQAYLSTTSPPATAPASVFRDIRTFDSAVAGGTIAVNGRWFVYATPADYVAFYASANTTDGALSTNGQVFIRRIG
jgi:hypothetical protein